MGKREILRNVENLALPYRETLELYYKEGLTQKEIAKKMQISLYRAKGNISKALYLVKRASNDIELKKAELILLKKRKLS